MTQYIKRLPAVFQTTTEKKFFDATFDQVFSKKDSDLLYGYLGRRIPGLYNPIKDFYVPEPNKDRTWWQLEATSYAVDENANKTNIFFYSDLLNKINYYGGNTLNQDRLFESQYYSWAPPIDFDMFINYQNYYWVEEGLSQITITGVLVSDIVGQPSYTTPNTANPAGLTLTTGLKILLPSDTNPGPYTVENVGYQNCDDGGIRLVPQFPDFTSGAIFEFLPWDSSTQISTGRIIQNSFWDQEPWETQTQPTSGDYITIERGSVDRNAWSRTNKWFHIDAINQTIMLTGVPFPNNSTRALRPIIQFTADLQLYGSGTQFKSEIQYGINDDIFGNPLLLSNFQGQTTSYISSTYGISFNSGDLFVFFADSTNLHNIYSATIDSFDVVTFTVTGTPAVEGDIVFIDFNAPYNGAQRGQTWYYSLGKWQEVKNDKVSTNQTPLFQLFDHNGIPLDDSTTYPQSNFTGNTIFCYKVNTTPGATVDPVLGFPIVYTSLGQSSDILFQNSVFIDNYTFGSTETIINGYYYYKTCNNSILYNNWNLYSPTAPTTGACNIFPVTVSSKQRVTDKFVVGFDTEYQFKLSVTPWGYDQGCPDLVVSVNGVEVNQYPDQLDGYTFSTINGNIYVDLTTYLTDLLLVTQPIPPVVEIDTYTHDSLDPSAIGYSEIPQQLEANPANEEITEISASNLIQQFSSIIESQIGFSGISFGGDNNYRDSLKNRTLGQYILQNHAPLLKSMLISSTDDLDFIPSVRFSSDEYTKFKNKFTNTALQLINQGFNAAQYNSNTIDISYWVYQILITVSLSKEFSNAFAYSYMIASGNLFASETYSIPAGPFTQTLTNYVDLSDPTNTLYIRTGDANHTLLVIGSDYELILTDTTIQVVFDSAVSLPNLSFILYKNPPPNYIPSTPTKVGAYQAFVPRIETDYSFTVPTQVIIGHDGSKTVAYGDYRDQLILELERRIYNKLQPIFITEYNLPLRIESVKSGYFRQTRYSRTEYLDITESYLNKWTAKNKANYRTNDWATFSQSVPTNQLWKLYNYTNAIVGKVPPSGQPAYYLPGNWKGIYQYYYDTIYPNTRPWEMLGFSQEPTWWQLEYGAPVTNSNGELAWTSTSAGLHNLWSDLQAGYIRRGPTAVYNPIDNSIVANPLWARPSLSNIIPVDSSGNIVPIPTLFTITLSGNPYEPFDTFDMDWVYGDGSPVEQAWYSASAYPFSVQEFLYLMRPGPFGELLFDTVGTSNNPGTFIHPTVGVVNSSINWQYIRNDSYSETSAASEWKRPQNQDNYVHAETVDNEIIIRFGYQRWISDRILFLNKDITSTFGQKIRTLNVNLANQFAGFTNKDTVSTYIESVSPTATSTTLLIPSNNFNVLLNEGQPTATYSYSGIIIRALSDGTFAVYGYDILNSQFTIFDRSPAQQIDITIGGTPAPFHIYEIGATYTPGDIVRYNGVYYESTITQTVSSFNPAGWAKLRTLPTVGGVSVIYTPVSLTTTTIVPYGSILKTPQDVFDLMIGWGAYLESQGWQFEDVNQDTNQVANWFYSAKQFLFWLNTNWAADSSIQLSPLANSASLIVESGYPSDVETINNGVYSILDKFGIAIPTSKISVNRDGRSITVSPSDLSSGGIYFLSVNTTETEHIIIFDNITNFNDTIYSPLLRARQDRIRFNGFRSNGWYGKKEAPGYLIIDNQLVPNYDTIVDEMRYYYDPNVTIDNPSIEDLGRHLIGYESKDYLDNLQVSNNVQYQFYQGAIRQKGTEQAFEKLFRSTAVQSNDIIQVFEEWALKLSNFGNTIEQVSTEFILMPEKNTGQVIVARLNYVPSTIGHISQINVVNAQNVYKTVPAVVIPAPDASPTDPNLTQPLRQAKAYIVLNSNGLISRVDITDQGYGYLSAPQIQISGADPSNLDVLYSVWQGDIITDTALDNVIDIDIDDTSVWTRRPPDPQFSLEFPTTPNIYYPIPNAGYVNFNDVTWASFDVLQTVSNWGSASLNPKTGDTVWIAKGFDEDWNVFKMVPANYSFSVSSDLSGNLLLQIPYNQTITTNFGFQVVLQLSTPYTGFVDPATNFIVSASIQAPSVTPVYLADCATTTDADLNAVYYNGVGNNGIGATLTGTGALPIINGVALSINDRILVKDQIDQTTNGIYQITTITPNWVMTRTSDFDSSTPIPFGATTVIDNGNSAGFAWQLIGGVQTLGSVIISFLEFFTTYNILALDGTPLTVTNIPNYSDFNTTNGVLLFFNTMRFNSLPAEPALPSYIGINEFIWIDNVSGLWTVFQTGATPGIWDSGDFDSSVSETWGPYNGWDTSGPIYFTPYRVQTPLINTTLFENAQVFDSKTRDELVLLPVYDPFKDILPGPAKQNLSYISFQDPARYNVTGNNRLFSENITFAQGQVGKLWWDLSNTRYVYYEQPIALSGTETDMQNLIYRRDRWGQLFPGSTVNIYEWVQSSVPPSQYTGSGIPRDPTSYVQVQTFDRTLNIFQTNYYFWVSGITTKPNLQNRTFAATDVARLLQNPKSQGFTFFSPIQQTSTNNCYMFYNVQEILAYQGDNVQIQYRLSERDDQAHAQWSFFREGDPNSLVTDQFWNKMVDSLCAYTQVLPISNEWSNGIFVASNLPWDSNGWDVAAFDTATSSTTPVYGEILPVPDPTLSESEKYGITYRPRQGMFVDIYGARKIFVQSGNSLLSQIPIRDNNPNWNVSVTSNVYWTYQNWYEIGYENVLPNWSFVTLASATSSLVANLLQLGDIVEVSDGTPDGRFVLYAVVQLNPNVSTLSFQQVGIQDSAILLLDTIFTTVNVYQLSTELRQLLNAFRTEVFINANIVDQNELFFSMINFVFSEQKAPDWVFKSSYIYIKEDNLPLSQDALYVPDQINNIMSYIDDVKPYHTQIRDYSSTYQTTDIAVGTASDSVQQKITITFGPETPSGFWDNTVWDNSGWDTVENAPYGNIIDGQYLNDNLEQFISQENVYTISIVTGDYDPSKIGYSQLFPYTVSFNSLNIDNPQTFITPQDIIGVTIGTTVLVNGQDFYVEYNADVNNTYTLYFFNNPYGLFLNPSALVPLALVWVNGESLQTLNFDGYRNEVASGDAFVNMAINVDTKLPVNNTSGVYSAFNDMWDINDPVIDSIITELGGQPVGFGNSYWDQSTLSEVELLDSTISYKENTDSDLSYYRNSYINSGVLVNTVLAPGEVPDGTPEWLDIITVFVDPTYRVNTDILPDPNLGSAIIWINGERIEYKSKIMSAANTWTLQLIQRGTNGTSAVQHNAGAFVFVENGETMASTSNTDIWVAIDNVGDPSTEGPTNEFSSVSSVPLGGLWYAQTPEAIFLKQSQGTAIP